MVELSETSKILREATPRSLVILDELGRGTSTFDGWVLLTLSTVGNASSTCVAPSYAIAYSVLHHLATRIRCMGLFSTHYGMLTQDFEKHLVGVGMLLLTFVPSCVDLCKRIQLVAKMYMDYFSDEDKCV